MTKPNPTQQSESERVIELVFKALGTVLIIDIKKCFGYAMIIFVKSAHGSLSLAVVT